jgi:NAD+-dependent secondary alcohol dehydrogenase Adh1
MKAARLHGYDDTALHLDEVPEPSIEGPRDVIVRIGGAGLCRTDLHITQGIFRGLIDPELPNTLGHENAGWVQEVGSAVTSVRPGDPVVAHPFMTCGVCGGCRTGEDMYCEVGRFPGAHIAGGFAEYVKTSEPALVQLPEGLDPKDVAPHADAGITAYRAARKAAQILPPGTGCVVIGIGGVGHIVVQCLKLLSATEVIAVDTSPEALQLAEQVGADHVIDGGEGAVESVRDLTDGHGVKAVVDVVGEHGTTQQAPAMLAQGGTYFVVGYGDEVRIPAIQMVLAELSVVGSLIGNHTELVELMALAAQGKVKLRTQFYDLDDVNRAIDDLNAGRIQGRAVLVPSGHG